MTVYAKFIEAGNIAAQATQAIFHIGASNTLTNPAFDCLEDSSGYYACVHNNGTTSSQAGGVAMGAAPAFGDTVELKCVLNADGSIAMGQSINGAAETTASNATSPALQPAWADTRLYLGSLGSSNHGLSPIIAIKVVSGVRTMAEMRDWDRAMLWPRQT